MNILICGNYGAKNLGDELMLKGLLKILKEISDNAAADENAESAAKNQKFEITVMSADQKNTEKLHGIKSVPLLPTGFRSILKSLTSFSIFKTMQAIKKTDFILFGGGGLFNEEEPYSLYLWFTHAKIFQWFHKKYCLIGQSFAPYQKKITKKILENIVNHAEAIIVRDEESRDILNILEIDKKIEVTTDPAFALTAEDFSDAENQKSENEKTTKKNELLSVLRSYKKEKIEQKKIQTLLEDIEKNMKPMPFHGQEITNELIKKYFEAFQKGEGIISMRLHGIILAVLAKTPFIALSYSSKVTNMAKKLNMEAWRVLPPFKKEEIASKIQALKHHAPQLQSQLQDTLQKQKQEIEKTKLFLTKILK